MAQQGKNGEFHRADPAYRRSMQVVLGITFVVGLVGLVALNLWLSRQGARLGGGDVVGFERAVHELLAGLCFVLGGAGLVFAIWLFRLASATRAERRWPPSQMRTSADVRIRYLTSADSLVTQMRAGAFGLLVVALALLGWGGWLLRSL